MIKGYLILITLTSVHNPCLMVSIIRSDWTTPKTRHLCRDDDEGKQIVTSNLKCKFKKAFEFFYFNLAQN